MGKALIDYCKAYYKVLELAVYVENQRAVDFYKKQGFSVIAEQENEDSKAREYVMRWEKVLSF
ncbi:MAG: GNAT family N-acetyltransferase [Candidatus Niameybacter stercoravium]|nr:GNAT family N-acetyltransferase [Candidatus Niameybacter stercoravium]